MPVPAAGGYPSAGPLGREFAPDWTRDGYCIQSEAACPYESGSVPEPFQP